MVFNTPPESSSGILGVFGLGPYPNDIARSAIIFSKEDECRWLQGGLLWGGECIIWLRWVLRKVLVAELLRLVC
jgi:hypothetical protein